MRDSFGPSNLTMDDIVKLVTVMCDSKSDSVSRAIGIFSGLGDNVAVSGDVLRQAVGQLSLSATEAEAAILEAIQNVMKTGDSVKIVNIREVRPVFSGTTVRVSSSVSFDVSAESGLPSIRNVEGIAVHESSGLEFKMSKLSTKTREN